MNTREKQIEDIENTLAYLKSLCKSINATAPQAYKAENNNTFRYSVYHIKVTQDYLNDILKDSALLNIMLDNVLKDDLDELKTIFATARTTIDESLPNYRDVITSAMQVIQRNIFRLDELVSIAELHASRKTSELTNENNQLEKLTATVAELTARIAKLESQHLTPGPAAPSPTSNTPKLF